MWIRAHFLFYYFVHKKAIIKAFAFHFSDLCTCKSHFSSKTIQQFKKKNTLVTKEKKLDYKSVNAMLCWTGYATYKSFFFSELRKIKNCHKIFKGNEHVFKESFSKDFKSNRLHCSFICHFYIKNGPTVSVKYIKTETY